MVVNRRNRYFKSGKLQSCFFYNLVWSPLKVCKSTGTRSVYKDSDIFICNIFNFLSHILSFFGLIWGSRDYFCSLAFITHNYPSPPYFPLRIWRMIIWFESPLIFFRCLPPPLFFLLRSCYFSSFYIHLFEGKTTKNDEENKYCNWNNNLRETCSNAGMRYFIYYSFV